MFKDGRRGQSSAQAGVGHAEEIRKASGGEPIYSELEVLKVTATKNHDLMELNRGIETLRNMGLGEVEIVPLKPLPLWWTDDSTDNQKPRNEEKDEQPDLLDYLFGGTLQKPKPKPGPKPDLLDSLFNGTLPNERKAMPKHQKPQSVQYREIITFDGSPDMLKTFHKVSCIIALRCVALTASSICGASHHCSQRLFRCVAFHLLSHIFSIPFHYSSMSQP